MTEENKKYILSTQDFNASIQEGKDFYIQFRNLNPEIETIMHKIIYRMLEKYDIQYLKETFVSVAKELVNNAIKANVKRIFFNAKNLDINKTEDYRIGMESFKAETYGTDDTAMFRSLEESKYVVRISVKTTEDHIHFSVLNNNPILDVELGKIQARIKKAFKYDNMADVFGDVLDDSEGAGLGLIMTIMLLKNCGLPADSFKITKNNETTRTTLSIPKVITTAESKKKIADEIIKEIDEIPSFPENIRNIQRLCSNPESTIKEISDNIALDPGLTATILKLANSAGYFTVRKIDSIEDSVKIIGIKGLTTLILASGVYKILDSRYKKFEKLWKESYKRAFYAQKIAIQMKHTKISDFAYLAGLLADIGYIILLSLDPDKIKNLQEIAGLKGIENSSLLEEIGLGVSHNSLGALICAKWKFNDALIKAIDYHHRPYLSPENYKKLIYIVYLATSFLDIEAKKMKFEILDDDVLHFFQLTDKKEFEILHSSLKEAYEVQTNPKNPG